MMFYDEVDVRTS